ncbi:MAG: glycosyltransferase [Candidatus Paceibacterota bacterium]|jgi:glycosyltransferase involved in cell wall biosynthesis
MGTGKRHGKRKVLYVITKSNWGGAQRYLYDLATGIPRAEFETMVALGGKGALKDKLQKSNVRVVTIPRLDRDIKFFDEFYVFYRLLRLYGKERPDIVHLNSSKIGGLGALAGRTYNLSVSFLNLFLKSGEYGLKTKIIFTAHGWAFNEERSFFSKIVIKLLAWLTIILSHETIAVSKNIADTAPKLFLPDKKMRVIWNGVSLSPALPKDEAIAALGGKLKNIGEEKTLRVVTIAELHKNKGLSYAIEAMSIIKKEKRNISYTIFGEGEEKKRLEKLVSRHNLSKVVKLAGFVDEASRLLKAFDIFLLPSITEALSISILEAGAAGMPVVATSVGGVPEIIEDMKTGILVRPRQPKELAMAILFMSENPERASEFGENLSRKIADRFSLGEMMKKTEELYGA